MASYKERHEAFMTGHGGSSPADVQLTVGAAQLGVVVLQVLLQQQWLVGETGPTASSGAHHRVDRSALMSLRFWVEFGLLLAPMMLAFTAPDALVPLLATELLAIILLLAYRRPTLPSASSIVLATGRKSFVETYRSMAMLSVCFAILAVDFPAFPRKFAKTESYGVSMMDAGVGSMIFSAGLVSYKPSSGPGWSSLVASVRRSLPLLFIGLGRTLSVKASDYHEHVSEYGVHWNFFLTLAIVTLVDGLVSAVHLGDSYLALGMLFALVQETLLRFAGLEAFIMTAPREDYVSSNKEGLGSLVGYAALYYLGKGYGRHLVAPRSKTLAEWRRRAWALLGASLALLMLWHFLSYMGALQTSRRMVNIGYILWVVVYNSGVIFVFMAADLYTRVSFDGQSDSLILQAINRNQLFVFLLGNISTGLVNMSLSTIDASDGTARVVLTLYMLFVCAVGVALHERRVTLKAW